MGMQRTVPLPASLTMSGVKLRDSRNAKNTCHTSSASGSKNSRGYRSSTSPPMPGSTESSSCSLTQGRGGGDEWSTSSACQHAVLPSMQPAALGPTAVLGARASPEHKPPASPLPTSSRGTTSSSSANGPWTPSSCIMPSIFLDLRRRLSRLFSAYRACSTAHKPVANAESSLGRRPLEVVLWAGDARSDTRMGWDLGTRPAPAPGWGHGLKGAGLLLWATGRRQEGSLGPAQPSPRAPMTCSRTVKNHCKVCRCASWSTGLSWAVQGPWQVSDRCRKCRGMGAYPSGWVLQSQALFAHA